MGGIWRGWLLAGGAILAWAAVVLAWLLTQPAPGMAVALFCALAVLVPGGLAFVLALTIRRLEDWRAEARALAFIVDELQETPPVPAKPSKEVSDMLARITERQRVTDRALYALLEGREADRTVLEKVAENAARAAESGKPSRLLAKPLRPAPKPETAQRSLPFDEPSAAEPSGPPEWPEILRALNFPTDADDTAGFRAMRRAMQDRSVAQVLRAAEDVLNLLSQDGIYMDDLDPVATDPSLWRRFAEGERGSELAGLAGIEDTTAISLTRGRMRTDEVMRDTALHFLRHFDLLLKEMAPTLADEDIGRLADTRTGRAFMLLATVTGALD
ncbi:hypothetical protein [Pontivivens ytuae]|uniref:Uncharacterized protein n=1 Tax=Pontivivens ytuae TaxID=2789856 RepID=A0A7S9LPH3_9RHOB|nr:hypothetical protein [Pontivivens ytuae]QPH52828.1 hypothetical protein I0K15_13535 [Pontivivens ytuae]